MAALADQIDSQRHGGDQPQGIDQRIGRDRTTQDVEKRLGVQNILETLAGPTDLKDTILAELSWTYQYLLGMVVHDGPVKDSAWYSGFAGTRSADSHGTRDPPDGWQL